jgi:hypothetical protein
MRVGGISETWSNIGDDIQFTFMFERYGLKFRCVIAGSVHQVLFYFMWFVILIFHKRICFVHSQVSLRA